MNPICCLCYGYLDSIWDHDDYSRKMFAGCLFFDSKHQKNYTKREVFVTKEKCMQPKRQVCNQEEVFVIKVDGGIWLCSRGSFVTNLILLENGSER